MLAQAQPASSTARCPRPSPAPHPRAPDDSACSRRRHRGSARRGRWRPGQGRRHGVAARKRPALPAPDPAPARSCSRCRVRPRGRHGNQALQPLDLGIAVKGRPAARRTRISARNSQARQAAGRSRAACRPARRHLVIGPQPVLRTVAPAAESVAAEAGVPAAEVVGQVGDDMGRARLPGGG